MDPTNWLSIVDRVDDFDISNATLDKWNDWFKRFTIVLRASAFDRLPNIQKVSLLLMKIKPLTLSRMLGIDDSTIGYDDLVEEIVQYLNPVNARMVLWQRKQQKNESFKSFASDLMVWFGPCQYRDVSIMRDVFLTNMDEAHTDIARALRRKYDVSLDEAIAFAEAMSDQACFSSTPRERQGKTPEISSLNPPCTRSSTNIRMMPISPGTHNVEVLYIGHDHMVSVCPVSMINIRQGFLDELNLRMKTNDGPPITPHKNCVYVALIRQEWVRVSVLSTSIADKKAEVLAKDYGWVCHVRFSVFRNLPLDFIPVDPLLWTVELRSRGPHIERGSIINIDVEQDKAMWIAELKDDRVTANASFRTSDAVAPAKSLARPKSFREATNELETAVPKARNIRDPVRRPKSEVRGAGTVSESVSSDESSEDTPSKRPLPSTDDSDVSQQTVKAGKGPTHTTEGPREGGNRSRSDKWNPGRNGSEQQRHTYNRRDNNNYDSDVSGNLRDNRFGGNVARQHFENKPRSAFNNNRNGGYHSDRERRDNQPRNNGNATQPEFQTRHSGFHRDNFNRHKSETNQRNNYTDVPQKPELIPRPVEVRNATDQNRQPRPRPAKYTNERKMPLNRFVRVVVLYKTENNIFIVLHVDYPEFEQLDSCLNEEVKKTPLADPQLGDLCLVEDEHRWGRAEIVRFSADKRNAVIKLIDYGKTVNVPLPKIMALPDNFWQVQPFAISAQVTNGVDPQIGDGVERNVEVMASSQDERGTWLVAVKPPPSTKRPVKPVKSSTQERHNNSPRPPHPPPIPRNTFTTVKVVYVGPEGSFGLDVSKMEQLADIQNRLHENLRPIQGLPVVGRVYAAPFEGDVYRAEVLKLNPDKATCRVVFVDFGNESDVQVRDLKCLPDGASKEIFTFKLRFESPSVRPADLLMHDVEVSPIVKQSDGSWLLQLKGDPSKEGLPDDNTVAFA